MLERRFPGPEGDALIAGVELPHDIFIDADANRLCRAISRYAEGVRHGQIAVYGHIPKGKKLPEEIAAAKSLRKKGRNVPGVAAVDIDPWWRLMEDESRVAHVARLEKISPAELARWIAQELRPPNYDLFNRMSARFQQKIEASRTAASARHKQTSEAKEELLKIWASGKFASKDRCASEECEELGLAYSTARRALRGLPDPDPWPGKGRFGKT